MVGADDSVIDSAPQQSPLLPRRPLRQRVVFHVTGFGVFNGVADNPTTHLVKELPGELEARRCRRAKELRRTGEEPWEGDVQADEDGFEVRSCVVLDVSASEGGRQLRELHASVSFRNTTMGCAGVDGGVNGVSGISGGGVAGGEKVADGGGSSGGKSDQDNDVTVFVHCGVNSASNEFALETQGFNEASFGAPDEQGYSPMCAPIDQENSDTRHCRVTTVPVAEVLERLRCMGWDKGYVVESKDAGRFVCNYIYYTSLGLCEKEAISTVDEAERPAGKGSGEREGPDSGDCALSDGPQTARKRHSLFVHVPPFAVISKERQLEFVMDCLSATAASLVGATGTRSTDGDVVPDGSTAVTAGATSVRPLAVSPCRASALREPISEAPSEFAHSSGSPVAPQASLAPPVVTERACPPTLSIWDHVTSPEGSSPVGASGVGIGGDSGGDGRGAQAGFPADGGNDTDENSDLSLRSGNDEDGRPEPMASVTRRRLVEAGFDELDVDAAMATTGSDNPEVIMQFLLDVAPLLPRGAPSDADGLYLRDFCNDTTSGGGIESYDHGRVTPGRGAPTSRDGKPRMRSMVSPARMAGVSPRWTRDISPVEKVRRATRAAGGWAESPRVVAGSGGGDQTGKDIAKARSGGLLSRLRRHKRAPSTASAASDTPDDGVGRERSSTPRALAVATAPSRLRSTSARMRGPSPEHEDSPRTMRIPRSHSPPRARAAGGSAARRGLNEACHGWGVPLATGPNLRLALLVRLDLGMGPGAMASQCARATLAAATKAEGSGGSDTLAVWREAGEAIVVLGATDAETLNTVIAVSYKH